MSKIIVGNIDGTVVSMIAGAGNYRITNPDFLDSMREMFRVEIYEVNDTWDGDITELRKEAVEQAFKKVGILENIRLRTKLMAQYLGIASIDLEGKTYNPQSRSFKRIPKNKLPKVYDKLYKKILNL